MSSTITCPATSPSSGRRTTRRPTAATATCRSRASPTSAPTSTSSPKRAASTIRGHYRAARTGRRSRSRNCTSPSIPRSMAPGSISRRTGWSRRDPVSGYTIYRLDTPLAPGAAMDFDFRYSVKPHGFPLSGGDTAVVYNGTFFNNMAALPQFGYDARPPVAGQATTAASTACRPCRGCRTSTTARSGTTTTSPATPTG